MRLLPENDRRLDPEGQELRWLSGRNLRGDTTFVGAVDELIVLKKTFEEEMNCAGREKCSGLTLFATGLLACSGSACGGEGAKRNARRD